MNFSEFVFSATEIAAFDFNKQTKRIWAATNNRDNSPQTWQFRYDPLFIPEISNNQILVKSEQWQENSWRTNLTILLDNDEARKLAYLSVCARYPEQAQKIQRSSIFALQIPYIKINIPDLKEVGLTFKIIKDYFEFAQPSQEFTIKIVSPDRDTALKIEKILSSITLEYEFSISARKSQQNIINFSLQKLKNSKLYVELNGLGDVVYVHRNDLRKLLDGIHTKVYFDAVIEKPEHFESGLFEKLLNYWNKSESSKEFDETKWQSTYHKNDLKPNVLTKELNKIFTKNESENHWKFNPAAAADLDIDANAGSAALTEIKSKIGSKLSLSNDDLKKLLREQDIEAEIQGTKIEVKSIELRQVNLANFNDENELFGVVTFIEPTEVNISKGSVEFSRLFSSTLFHVKNNELAQYKKIALFGKASVGKSAILNSLIGADIAANYEQGNLLTICFKSPFIWLDLPGIIGNRDYEQLAIKKAQQADGQIFVIDGEPYEDEMELFNLVHAHSPDIPKVVFVNKWDIIQNNNPKKEQETIRSLISEKMGKFVKYKEDIIYGSAMIFDRKNDEMLRQEIPQLINKIKELF